MDALKDFEGTMIFVSGITACSFAVWAPVCWNWAVRAARTALPLSIPAPYVEYVQKLGTRRPESFVGLRRKPRPSWSIFIEFASIRCASRSPEA